MDKFDYKELGLRCGLEIHQQLNTKKLFCECLSVLRSDEPDFTVKRKLHAVAGESGEIDIAARYQASLEKNFIYQGYDDTTCLVELDEAPPREINRDALKIAVQVALLLNCKIIPITQIMRKTVIDGSNTSGFQRTALIARDGYVETAYGKIGIESVCLEEDSARIISGKNNEVTYRLDRLGIPLIEIATSPNIFNPDAAKEVALHIGNVLRSCDVRRGIGTIRQDVNMSLMKFGGTRIEIKGVQEPALIIKTINSEIERESKEKKKIEPQVRKALESGETEFLRPMPGASRMYPETDLPLLRIKKEFIDEVKRSLPKLRSEIAEELKHYGLHEELIKLILKEDEIDEFKELAGIVKNPEIVAKALVLYPRELASKNNLSEEKINELLNKDILASLLEAVAEKKISEGQVKEVMEKIAGGKELEEALKFEEHDFDKIEEKIINLIREKPGLSPNAYMGLLMKELKGKIDAKSLMEVINRHLK
ncbi:MAG: Glu-tRNA(Gln) amidotransferase subunit GatE [Candidatus Pacearchaeota archaeon]|nr:Glu-tRNA(Gln) amidotransferase subunit GatE [Candidatus Pacearchaeota archaeon]